METEIFYFLIPSPKLRVPQVPPRLKILFFEPQKSRSIYLSRPDNKYFLKHVFVANYECMNNIDLKSMNKN